MFALPSVVSLSLFLVAPSERVASLLPTCAAGTRSIELEADGPSKMPEVCVRPELSLSLFFDVRLMRVEIEGPKRFRRVDKGDSSLTLIATEALHDGDRVPVTVYFQDDAAPMSATIMLVVHPSQAERQVEVSRHTRSVASYRQGEQQALAEAQQCQAEKTQIQAEYGGGGLSGFIAHGWLGEKGIVARVLEDVVSRPGDLIQAKSVISYRAVGSTGRGRVAVQAALFNGGATTWTPAGAALVDLQHAALKSLNVTWSVESLQPGDFARVVLEADATESEALGPFTLKVWDARGLEGASISNVTFP